MTISTSPNYCTQFTCAVTGSGATDTIALSGCSPIADLHKQLYFNYDCAGNRTGVQGDSSGSFPSGLTTTATQYFYNNLNQLGGSPLSVAAGGPIRFQGSTVNPIKSCGVNVTQTATISDAAITPGDVLWLCFHNSGLSQSENVKYLVQSGDSASSIATGLTSALNADSTLSGLGMSDTGRYPIVFLPPSAYSASIRKEELMGYQLFTQKQVDTVANPRRKQVILRDSELTGFGLRVTPGLLINLQRIIPRVSQE